jgi:signal transduction histidine kinase/ActR/RegA family two-component response regulator
MPKISMNYKKNRYSHSKYTPKDVCSMVDAILTVIRFGFRKPFHLITSFWVKLNITIMVTVGFASEALSYDFQKIDFLSPSLAIAIVTTSLLLIVFWLYFLSIKKYHLSQKQLKHQTQLLVREIENHQQTYTELKQTRKSAEAASVSKSLYLERISHELRTPLNSVMGYAQLLEGAEDIPPSRRESIKVMRSSSEHLTDLIEGLIDMSKIEAGRLDLHRNEVDLFGMIEQLVHMFQIQAKAKNLELSFTHQKKLPKFVIADSKRLRQVLINLISNAIKFTQKGSVTVNLKYRNQVAFISVKDTGVGIKEADIESIKEPFVRVTNDNYHTTGSGLGLAITQALIHCMGGDLNIKSKFGDGSTFNLSLMLPSAREIDYQPVMTEKILGYHGDTKSLMVVDDDINQRSLLVDVLTPLGFKVFTAADGASCLSMLDDCSPALFMLDISMPGMTGWQLAEKLRAKGIKVPIVMISAEAAEGLVQDTDAPLHNDYLVKPINITALLHTLAFHLNIRLRTADQVNKREMPDIYPHNPFSETDIIVVNELLSLIEIGYLEGFKNTLADAKQQGSIDPDVCDNLYKCIKKLDLSQIRIQLMSLKNEIKS